MLTLFEVLSFKGWLDVRDILIKALGPVSVHTHIDVESTLVVMLKVVFPLVVLPVVSFLLIGGFSS